MRTKHMSWINRIRIEARYRKARLWDTSELIEKLLHHRCLTCSASVDICGFVDCMSLNAEELINILELCGKSAMATIIDIDANNYHVHLFNSVPV